MKLDVEVVSDDICMGCPGMKLELVDVCDIDGVVLDTICRCKYVAFCKCAADRATALLKKEGDPQDKHVV